MIKYKEDYYLSLRPKEERKGISWPFVYSHYGYPLFMDTKNNIQKLSCKLFRGYAADLKSQKLFNIQMENWV